MNILPTNAQQIHAGGLRFNNGGNAAAGRNRPGDTSGNNAAGNTNVLPPDNQQGENDQGGNNVDPVRWAIRTEKDLIERSRHDVANLTKIYHLDAGAQRALTGVRKDYNETIRQATVAFLKGGAKDRAGFESALSDARKSYEAGILGITRGDNDGQSKVGDGVGAPEDTGNDGGRFAGAQGSTGVSFDDFG